MRSKNSETTISIILALILVYYFNSYIFGTLFNYILIPYLLHKQPQLNFHNLLFSTLNQIPIVIGIIGLIVFVKSKYKKNNILRFYMAFIVVMTPIDLGWVFYLINRIVSNQFQSSITSEFLPVAHHANLTTNQIFIILAPRLIPLSSTIINTVVCWYGLFILSKNKALVLQDTEQDGKNFYLMRVLKPIQRFFNQTIDLILIIYLTLSVTNLVKAIYISKKGTAESLFEIDSLTSFLLVFFYYYLFMEGIFGFTAAKCITSSMVVTEAGEKPGFLQILGRTICRFIPMDALIFLDKKQRGWHDAISNTYVVEVVEAEEQEFD